MVIIWNVGCSCGIWIRICTPRVVSCFSLIMYMRIMKNWSVVGFCAFLSMQTPRMYIWLFTAYLLYMLALDVYILLVHIFICYVTWYNVYGTYLCILIHVIDLFTHTYLCISFYTLLYLYMKLFSSICHYWRLFDRSCISSPYVALVEELIYIIYLLYLSTCATGLVHLYISSLYASIDDLLVLGAYPLYMLEC